jgi:L-asparaginase
LRLLYAWPTPDPEAPAYDLQHLARTPWPRVEIIFNYVGANAAIVKALCALPLGQSVQGLIVAGTGNGTLSEALEAALLEVQGQGVAVLRCSRCAYGRVVSSRAASGLGLAVSPLSPVKARIALMLAFIQSAQPVADQT